ncbi:MAG TPA: RHS repeat-associated core domain-containing protein [Candidatus Nanoarchaeia archaeon]|nr:RHS repeat-associated core domain-containing protein [Candidatus Nanoarchaeia archaeon]
MRNIKREFYMETHKHKTICYLAFIGIIVFIILGESGASSLIPGKEVMNSLGSRNFNILEVQKTDNEFAFLIESKSKDSFRLMFTFSNQNGKEDIIYDNTEVTPFESRWVVLRSDSSLGQINTIEALPYDMIQSKVILFVYSSQIYLVTGQEEPISVATAETGVGDIQGKQILEEPQQLDYPTTAQSRTLFYAGSELFKDIDSNNIQRYYHYDIYNSVVIATDNNGNPVITREYSPFGLIWKEYGSPTEIRKSKNKFLGKEFENKSALYAFDYRFYDPDIGRFTQPDPIKTAGSSPYAYANNNPLSFVDPNGLQGIPHGYFQPLPAPYYGTDDNSAGSAGGGVDEYGNFLAATYRTWNMMFEGKFYTNGKYAGTAVFSQELPADIPGTLTINFGYSSMEEKRLPTSKGGVETVEQNAGWTGKVQYSIPVGSRVTITVDGTLGQGVLIRRNPFNVETSGYGVKGSVIVLDDKLTVTGGLVSSHSEETFNVPGFSSQIQTSDFNRQSLGVIYNQVIGPVVVDVNAVGSMNQGEWANNVAGDNPSRNFGTAGVNLQLGYNIPSSPVNVVASVTGDYSQLGQPAYRGGITFNVPLGSIRKLF